MDKTRKGVAWVTGSDSENNRAIAAELGWEGCSGPLPGRTAVAARFGVAGQRHGGLDLLINDAEPEPPHLEEGACSRCRVRPASPSSI